MTATYAGDPRYNGEFPNTLSKEFEEAARVRDEIHRLRTQGLMA